MMASIVQPVASAAVRAGLQRGGTGRAALPICGTVPMVHGAARPRRPRAAACGPACLGSSTVCTGGVAHAVRVSSGAQLAGGSSRRRSASVVTAAVPAGVPPWHPDADAGDMDPDVPTPGFASIAEALVEVAAGKFVVVLDDEDRENEGDLIGAADLMTQESLNFMIRYTSGLVCVSVDNATADRLNLPLMVSSKENEDAMKTSFTVSCDLAVGGRH